MIGINQGLANQMDTEEANMNRRRRTPSKYAESIRELAKMSGKPSKKDKNLSSNQEEDLKGSEQDGSKDGFVSCYLPTLNKKLRLSIIIKKQTQKPKIMKKVSRTTSEKEKFKEPPKGKSLLDTLLEACEQVKEDDEQNLEGKEGKNQQAGGPFYTQRLQSQARKQKEEEEKYLRLYERYQSLREKLEHREFDVVLI